MADACIRRSTAAIDAELAALVDDGEVGIQVAMVRGDELLIDAWAGHTDLTRAAHVSGETMFPIFSVSKAITAAAVHLQAERGHQWVCSATRIPRFACLPQMVGELLEPTGATWRFVGGKFPQLAFCDPV